MMPLGYQYAPHSPYYYIPTTAALLYTLYTSELVRSSRCSPHDFSNTDFLLHLLFAIVTGRSERSRDGFLL